LASDIIREVAVGKQIVAIDGACEKFNALGLMPQVIVGDFDSVSLEGAKFWGIHQLFDDLHEHAEPYQGHHQVTIVPTKDQNLIGLTKAIRYCDQQGAESIDLVCVTGGRTDQTIGNFRALRSEYKKNRPIFLHTNHETIFFAKDERVEIKGNIGDYCGIFAFPAGKFSSRGLQYNGDNYPLEFAYSESGSNQLIEPVAHLDITGEALIIQPGQFAAQSHFRPEHL